MALNNPCKHCGEFFRDSDVNDIGHSGCYCTECVPYYVPKHRQIRRFTIESFKIGDKVRIMSKCPENPDAFPTFSPFMARNILNQVGEIVRINMEAMNYDNMQITPIAVIKFVVHDDDDGEIYDEHFWILPEWIVEIL